MDFDKRIPTELATTHNVRMFIVLIIFWSLGALYPLAFWPQSYAKIKHLEQAIFPESEKYKFDQHLYSSEVYAYLERFTNFYKHKAKMFTLKQKTFEGRSIKVIRLRFPEYKEQQLKGRILVVSGVYAPAWDAVSAAIDLIHKLCEECKYKVPFLVNYEWYIVPILNPDGYDYTLSMRDKNLKEARNPKNRVFYNTSENVRKCRGVYLNRNFGFHWGESKPEDYKNFCWIGFAGMHPFSENETIAFTRFVESLYKNHMPITMYLQLQGNTKIDTIWYPWKFTIQPPISYKVLEAMAKGAAEQATTITGAYFFHDQGGRQDLGSGVIGDWIRGTMNVIYSFNIEPTFLVCNSSDACNQQIYIEKARIVIFSLVKYLLELRHAL